MPGTRDPYYEWLGIPPKDQPPNHYRLLGLEIFEENRNVIAAAADRQMSFVKSYQCGEDSELSQRILNELSAARICLLNPENKAAYDTRLRSELEPLETDKNTHTTETNGLAPWIEYERVQPVYSHTRRVSEATPDPTRVVVITMCVALACTVGGVGVGLLLLRTLGRDHSRSEDVVQHGEKIPETADTKSRPTAPNAVNQREDETTAGSSLDTEESSAVEERLPGFGPESVVKNELPEPDARSSGMPESTSTSTGRAEFIEPTVRPPPAKLIPQDKPIAESDRTIVPPAIQETNTDRVPLPERRQVPDVETQQRITEEIAGLYDLGPDVSPSKKKQLCEDFLELARDPKETQERRFVLLRLATQLACETGDTSGMLQTVDEIGASYEVRTAELKARMLVQMLGDADDSTRVMTFLRASQEVVIEAAKADDFEAAHRLSTVAAGLCDRNVGGADFRQGIRDRHVEVEKLRHEHAQAQKALLELEKDNDNPVAHLTVGRWLCFVKNRWDQGLPHLAKCSDERLREIANRELVTVAVDATGRIALAELWWNLAQDADEDLQYALLSRSRHWYGQVDQATLGGIDRAKTQQRMVQIDNRLGLLSPASTFLFEEPRIGLAEGATSTASSQDVPSLFNRALTAALQNHDYQLAARLFGRCVESEPELVPALNNYALASLRSGNARRAVHLWETACKLAPQTEAIARNLSMLSCLGSSGHVSLDRSIQKDVDALLSAAGGQLGTRVSTFGFLYMPLDGEQDTSSQYLDQACIYCNGLGRVPCPVRGCSRGTVASKRTDTVGRNPITGQAIVKITPIRVPCRNCGGQGTVDCGHCSNGKLTRIR